MKRDVELGEAVLSYRGSKVGSSGEGKHDGVELLGSVKMVESILPVDEIAVCGRGCDEARRQPYYMRDVRCDVRCDVDGVSKNEERKKRRGTEM